MCYVYFKMRFQEAATACVYLCVRLRANSELLYTRMTNAYFS